MKNWAAGYGGFVLGVLAVAGVGYWYYVTHYGEQEEE